MEIEILGRSGGYQSSSWSPVPHHDALNISLIMRASVPMSELVRHVIECNRPETRRLMFPEAPTTKSYAARKSEISTRNLDFG